MGLGQLKSGQEMGRIIQRYGLAALGSLLLTGFNGALTPLLQPSSPFIVLLAAPLLAAWFGGLGPGLLATVLSLLFSTFVFPSSGLLNDSTWLAKGLEVMAYLFYGAAFSWLNHQRVQALDLAEGRRRELADTQQALTERQQRAQDTLEASPSGMIVVNRQGGIELVNSPAERMFGLARDHAKDA